MIRDWNMNQRSDGRLYTKDDLAKLGCEDCKGCWSCCQNMGKSAVLDPWDIYCLCKGTNKSFEELLQGYIELSVVDGLILPNLAMDDNQCSFLDAQGRCSIHEVRPGVCRLFPLGRIYQEDGFAYFLQKDECKIKTRTKVKVKHWLGIENLKDYEAFILDWHNRLKACRESITQNNLGHEELKALSMKVLTTYYLAPYDLQQDFYMQYYGRTF